MARRLVEAGYPVLGFDVMPEARARAVSGGVPCADRLEIAVSGANTLITMLPDSDAVETVLTGPEVAPALSSGTVVVDMSSSEPLRTRAIAARLAERGVDMLDAPVSGGVAGAEGGRLTVMVGGAAELVEAYRGVLEVFGRVVHAGPTGSGHAIKALNNLLSATHLLSACEAMATGERFGLDPAVMLEVFNSSSGRSGSTENKFPNFILPNTFDSGFGLRLMVKDVRIAVELAVQEGVDCALSAEALDLWSEAAMDLPPRADHTEIARWLAERGQPRAD